MAGLLNLNSLTNYASRSNFRAFRGWHSIGGRRNMRLWCEWLEQHGIVPESVPTTGWIFRDEVNYRIRYIAFVLNERGDTQIKPGTRDVWVEERFVQLEGKPLPFPVP